MERETSLDHDSGSFFAEVAKTIADPTIPGPMVSDDDRKSCDLSERNHSPDIPPTWTPPSPHLPPLPTSERQVDIPATLKVTHSSRVHVSELPSSRIIDLPLPVFSQITLRRSSLSSSNIHNMLEVRLASSELGSNHSNAEVGSAAPDPLVGGLLNNAQNGDFHSTLDCQDVRRPPPPVLLEAQPSRTTQPDSHPLSIPAHLEDSGRPTAVLGPTHKGFNSETGTPSHRTALGSLSSRLRTSVDQGTLMRARRRERGYLPQSSNVSSARSEASLSSSDDFPITTRRGSGPPLSQVSNLPEVSLARKDGKTQAVKRIPKSMPRPCLVPGLRDQAYIPSDEASIDKGDPPCASGKARKGCRPNDYCVSSRSHDISSPDYSLHGDSGERVRLRIIIAFTDLDISSQWLEPRCSGRAGLRL